MTQPVTSTYRLQLHAGFTFADVASLAPYLRDLGVSHAYLSPILQAAPGSDHGYDVVDPTVVSAELGGEPGLAAMVAALHAAGLGVVADIVPNHMAIGGPENRWWWDVLENGPASLWASHFDVDWDPPEPKLRHTVLMPILPDHYGRVLESGRIGLSRDGGSFIVICDDHVLPVAPRSLDVLLEAAAERCGHDELAFLAHAAGNLPLATATDRASVQQRHRHKEVLRRRLAALTEEDPAVAAALDETAAEWSRDPDRLDALLERQNYRLAYWRTAGRELDYRRFFDITTLAGLRVEEERVFVDTHGLILRLTHEGTLDGLRVDHPDGLRDPEAYTTRLRVAAGDAWIVVEKILDEGEELPAGWPVDGTTGYDALNLIGGLFVDPAGAEPLQRIHAAFTGDDRRWPETLHAAKHSVLRHVLANDLVRLSHLLVRICEGKRRYRDFTRHDLHEAVRELLVSFPVYRTYIRPDIGDVGEFDRHRVETAVNTARERRPEVDGELFDFLRDLLLLRHRGPRESEFVARLQQATGPVMAKGGEDTAFYIYNRLTALNEVGGDPGRFGVGVEEFHAAMARAAQRCPRAMVTLSTHDTKRSGDVRARLCLLSEIPDRWEEAVWAWAAQNETHRHGDLPDRAAEYLLYQTLVGAHPLPVDRTWVYMEKAVREAKQHTSWIDADVTYEAALRSFVEGALADPAFNEPLASFAASLVEPGRQVSLAQELIRLTAPGVADTYQGGELWDLSLVDPDNRRPVDFEARMRLLADVAGGGATDALTRGDEGAPKLFVVQRALRLRRQRPDLLAPGTSYEPLWAEGPQCQRVVAFCRGGGTVTVVPRLVLGLHHGWGETRLPLPPGRWRDVLTGRQHHGAAPLADLVAGFPVALLLREGQ